MLGARQADTPSCQQEEEENEKKACPSHTSVGLEAPLLQERGRDSCSRAGAKGSPDGCVWIKMSQCIQASVV